MTAHAATENSDHENYGKHEQMIVHEREPFNAEPPPALLRESFVTPTGLFYVRNHAPVPNTLGEEFRLAVEGETERALTISVAELKERFAPASVTATLQCAGNRRNGMERVAHIPGEVPWASEAIGTARWTGVRLADVLQHTGATTDACHVSFLGADRVEKHGERFGFGGSVPMSKAMAGEVLLAYEMNGEPLTPVHGAPLRVVVPGYIGARSVKWLERISLTREPSDNYYQQKTYRVYPTALTAQIARPEDGIMLGALSINSSISSHADESEVEAGRVRLEGWAATAGGEREIARVEISRDAGATWHTAQLHAATNSQWAWRFWTMELDLAPGTHALAVRAWDSAANTQPATAAEIWNFKGYMNNAWHRITLHAM